MKTMMKVTAMAVVVAMVLAIIIVLVAIFCFSKPAYGEETKVITGSFIISGYRPGEFAIKGEPEKTLNKGIADLKAKITKSLSGPGELRFEFAIVGSADVTGKSAANDELAAKRAEQVKAVLSATFSDAKIEFWSKGSANNVRRVEVAYLVSLRPIPIAPVVVEKVVEKESKSPPYLVLGLCIAVAILLLFLITGNGEKKKKKTKKATEPTVQWIKDLDVENERYAVKVEVNGKFWKSPFISNSGARIVRDSKRGIIESLKGCLKKEEFKQQKIELIRKGIINVARER